MGAGPGQGEERGNGQASRGDLNRPRLAGVITAAMIVAAVVLALAGSALGLGGAFTTRDVAYPTPSISGTVMDSTGTPIATEDVCVQASRSVGGGIVRTATANLSGEYTLSGLNPGSYYVHAYDCGGSRNDVATYYTGSGTSPALVSLSSGQAVTDVDVRLAQATEISGVVHGGSTATNLANVCVDATPVPTGEGYAGHTTLTASDGSYTLTRIAPNVPYVLRFDPGCEGASQYTGQYWDGEYTAATATQVSATVAQPATVDPVLAAGATISGTISAPAGESVDMASDVCVYAEPIDGGAASSFWDWDNFEPNADGSYQITGLPPGSYYVYASQCGSAEFSTTYYGVDAQGYPTEVTVSGDQDVSSINFQLEAGASISGHLYGGDGTSDPLDGACVEADYLGGGLPGASIIYGDDYATTASDGSYTLSGLASDATYTVYFDPSCMDASQGSFYGQYYNGASDPGDAAEVLAPASGVDGHLTAASSSGSGTIAGTVSEGSGTAIGAGDVCLEAIPESAGQYGFATADAGGSYEITDVAPGSYYVYAYSCDGSNDFGSGYYATGGAVESLVSVANGATATANIVLPATSSISGTVYGGTGTSNPLAGVCVTASPTSSPNGTYQSVEVSTAADGTYSLTDLDVGTSYDVSFDPSCADGGTLYQERWYSSGGGSDDSSDATAIVATQSPITGINANLDTGATISGTVDDAAGDPITTGDICVSASGPSYRKVSTDASGDYTITGLPPGTYYVHFEDCAGSSRDDLPQYYNAAGPRSSAETVTLSEGGDQTGIDATLAAGTAISGSVYAGAGTGTPLADICVDLSGPNYRYKETSSAGTYSFTHLPPGNYRVYFSDCSSVGYLGQYYDGTSGGTSDYADATDVHPTASQPSSGIDAHMSLGGSVSGTITDASGHPVGDACVQVYDEDGDWVNGSDSNYAGHYTVGSLPTGSYTVEAFDCGQDDSLLVDDLAETSGTEAVTQGATTGGVNLTLAPATSISGRAVGQSGSERVPVEDTCVTVENTDGSEVILANGDTAEGYTNGNGGYTVTGLPAGTYVVQFSDCDGGSSQYLTTYYNSSYIGGSTNLDGATPISPTVADPSTDIEALMGAAPVATITGGPEADAATNATSATISFSSSVAGSSFECSLDYASLAPCTSPYTTSGLASGTHHFEVEATVDGETQPDPTELDWTVSSNSSTNSTSGTVSAGGTFSTDPGATVSDTTPVIVAVTAPDIPALADGATITEQTDSSASTPSPNGYQVFGSQMQISVTAAGSDTDVTAPVNSPIALSFQVAASQLPAGMTYQQVTVTRNGSPLADCTSSDGSATPDPCVSSRTESGSGASAVITLTVLTTECSTWNFAAIVVPVNDSAPAAPSGTAQVGQTLTANPGSWSDDGNGLAYQWQRCSSSSTSSCSNISGATGSTYTLTGADQGQYIRVVVTASNASGSTSAASALTAQVAAAPSSASGGSGGGSAGSGGGSVGSGGGSAGGSQATVSPPQISLVRVLGSGTTARVTVRCSGGPGAACAGALLLSTVEKVKAGKHKTKTRTVTLGRGSVQLASGGATKVVSIGLNGTGRALLGRLGRLAVTIKLTPAAGTAGSAASMHLTMHRPAKHKKK